MSYDLRLSIQEDSPEGRNIDAIVSSEHISREQAALRLLAQPTPSKAGPAARRLVGAFRATEDVSVLDEALELAMKDRQRRNAQV